MNFLNQNNNTKQILSAAVILGLAVTLPIQSYSLSANSFDDSNYTWSMPSAATTVNNKTVSSKPAAATPTKEVRFSEPASSPNNSQNMVANHLNDNLLVRTIPIDISRSMSQNDLRQQITTPQATLSFIENQKNLMLHMEAIRQAYWLYGRNDMVQANVLINSLKKRYMANQNDPVAYFDYGYAQLVNDGNKNGLFFLRKANDSLGSSVTSLAYGLAEIDADLVFENANPNEVTTRKMDVGYRLSDALDWNKTQKVPGIWPTFVSIRNAIRNYPGFDRFGHEDFSLRYVPTGKASLTSAGFRLFTNPVIQDPQSQTATKPTKKTNRVAQPDAVSLKLNSQVQDKVNQSVANNTSNKPNFLNRFFGIRGPKQNYPTPELSPIVKADNLSQVVAAPQYNKTANTVADNEEISSNIPWTLKQDDQTPQDLAFTPERVQLNTPQSKNVVMLASQPDYAAPAVLSTMASSQRCEFPQQNLDPKTMKYAAVMQLQGHEPPEALEFYNADPEKYPYTVRVLNASKHVIGQFTSSKAPFIMEDLNKDGMYELVVRQYFVDPYHPVMVYRWNGNCYSADTSVQEYFE